jgi:crotonobetaine/carnitine-CoA ligase
MYIAATRVFEVERMGPDDVFFNAFPNYHLSGKLPLHMMALVGGSVLLKDQFQASRYIAELKENRVTVAVMFEGMLRLVEEEFEARGTAGFTLRQLAPTRMPRNAQKFCAEMRVRLSRCFALTETGPIVALFGKDALELDGAVVGRPVAGWPEHEVRVVDDHDNVVPAGEVGELIVRTSAPWALSSGYFGMPAETAAAWRNGWFHTGDAARQDPAGNVTFVDRLKDAIRRRGENISSSEVEWHIATHPDVKECAVVAAFTRESGDCEVRAFVVRTPASTLTQAGLIHYLIPHMPRFMIPRYVDFVETLPKTPTQKVRKSELRDRPLVDSWDREIAGADVPR